MEEQMSEKKQIGGLLRGLECMDEELLTNTVHKLDVEDTKDKKRLA